MSDRVPQSVPSRRAWLISFGTELTLGQTVDTNASWLAQQLAALGVRVERFSVVADDIDAIRTLLRDAVRNASLIICTGGLGPTEDDLTRQTLAEVANVPLSLDAASLEQIRAFFTRRGRVMPERNSVQAMFPAGATPIENTCGSAPGIRFEIGAATIFAMPGVPFEMKAMFARDVAPALQMRADSTVIRSRLLNTIGLGESDIGERIHDLMTRGRNPDVGTTAANGVVGIRINATASSDEAATRLLDETEAEIRSRLGKIVFGRDRETIAEVVGRLLSERGETLSVAESCTGGWLGKRLTDTPGSSCYFVGGVIAYANELKTGLLGVSSETLSRSGAVSEAVAAEMAVNCCNRTNSTYAISATGIAGPSGGSKEKPVGLVWIGLATPTGVSSHEFRFGADAPRELIRLRSVNHALNLLRLRLIGAGPL